MNSSQIMKKVISVCRKRLLKDENVLNYLYNRGITNSTIEKFQIGLFPNSPQELFSLISAKDLRSSGLIRNATSSVFTTWNLIMPIYSVHNNIVAIAGRTLLSEKKRNERNISKYMNTVYAKAHHLFGLNFAKKEILKQGFAYVVEGYMDVIAAHQAGLLNTVGCCGTAFSKRQLSLLARYAKKAILLFDNDKAGIISAEKHVKEKNCKEIIISSAQPFVASRKKDLDEFLRENSIKDLINLIKSKDGYNVAPLW